MNLPLTGPAKVRTTHQWLLPLWIWLDKLDSIVNGLSGASFAPVRVMTAAGLPANTYVTATQTKTANANGLLNSTGVDGVTTLALGDRIWDKNATGLERGPFVITDLGSAGTPWKMQRAADGSQSSDFVNGKTVQVGSEGTANANTSWALTNVAGFILDTTTPVLATENAAGALTVAGVQTNVGIKTFTQLTLAVWNAAKSFAASFTFAGTQAVTVTIPDVAAVTIAQAGVASGSTTPGAGGGTAPAFVPGAITKVLAGATIGWAGNVGTISAGGAVIAANALRGGIVNDGTLWGIIESNSALTATTGTITMIPLPVGSVPTGVTIDAYAQASDAVASHTHTGAAHTHAQT